MTNQQIIFIGWILFIVPTLGFCIASFGNLRGEIGSIVFLIACVVLMIPFIRKNE